MNNIMQQAIKLFKEADIKNAIVSIYDSTGIAGFQFNIPQREQIKLTNEITDYYTDSNAVFNDHVAYKPVMITLSGLQGEHFYSIHQIKDLISLVGTTMKLVDAFRPQLTAAQKQKRQNWNKYVRQQDKKQTTTNIAAASWKDEAKYIFNNIRTYDAVDLFKLFQDLYKFKSAQTRAYLFFEIMRYSDKPFTVETRWKRYERMYITDVTITAEDSADITDFQVTFKQMNFANSQAVSINAAGRTQQQYWQETNKGLDKGTKVETI